MKDETLLKVKDLSKELLLRDPGGISIPVLEALSFELARGECMALAGPRGSGKSTLLRCLCAKYLARSGAIWVRAAVSNIIIDLTAASPWQIAELRRTTFAYASHTPRIVPHVGIQALVAEPLLALGSERTDAMRRAGELLERMNVPQSLWSQLLERCSVGERQRINLAHALVADKPLILLDEPTTSLDASDREVVVDLIHEALERGAAVVGIFDDPAVRYAVANRSLRMRAPRCSLAA